MSLGADIKTWYTGELKQEIKKEVGKEVIDNGALKQAQKSEGSVGVSNPTSIPAGNADERGQK